MNWWMAQITPVNQIAQQMAEQRQLQLTKPAGSLGMLEQVVIQLAGLQGTPHPQLCKPWISIFAGDHGIMQEQISAFPQAVTRQMLQNFATGGACISVIAREHAAYLQVIDCGTVGEAYHIDGVETHCIRAGTANFIQTQAMTAFECQQALNLGRESVEKPRPPKQIYTLQVRWVLEIPVRLLR